MAFFESPEWLGNAGKAIKRKAMIPGDVIDEFSNFSLSPATKIRRLDSEMTFNIPGETPISAMACEPTSMEESLRQQPGDWDESRAIVLYRPIDKTIFEYPPSLKPFLKLNPDLISVIRSDQSSSLGGNSRGDRREKSMALIPWVAAPETGEMSLQEEGETGPSSMDVEEVEEEKKFIDVDAEEMERREDIRHWKQSCVPPPLMRPSSSIPVMWTWS